MDSKRFIPSARQEEVIDLGHDGTHRIHGEDQVTGQDLPTASVPMGMLSQKYTIYMYL
jgi:hypothetical protein